MMAVSDHYITGKEGSNVAPAKRRRVKGQRELRKVLCDVDSW